MRSSESLERLAALDEDAEPRRLRDPGDECDRRSQDQRTRGRGDQHGQPSNGVARQQPGTASDDEGDRKQQQRIAIREADKRCLRGLSRIDQPDDACVRAFTRRSRGPNFERLPCVDRTAPRQFSLPARNRDRFTGQHRLIDHRARTDDDPVDRDHLTGPHQNDVAYNHLLNWDVGNRRILPTMGNSRSTIDQGLQVAFGSGDCKVLQYIAACIHHGDNDPCQILAKSKSGGHRDESDCIDPHATRQEVADHRNEQTDNNGRSSRGPNPICQFTATYAPMRAGQEPVRQGRSQSGLFGESAL